MKPIDEKAVRLVLERRVVVTASHWIDDANIYAEGTVDGYHDTYKVSVSPGGGVCTCPAGANHRKCSHVTALELEVHQSREGMFDTVDA